MSSRANSVLVAMSGGVDSSVAAWMLLDRGYEVTGVFLRMGTAGPAEESLRGCCSRQDAADARRVAEELGIELYVLNAAEDFEAIIQDFADQYARGRTPNPCIHCNARIKFARLLALADSTGTDFVATGHHARMASVGGRAMILRGRAVGKDQSYALFAVARSHLPRILLPVGELTDKAEVRRIARSVGLPVHDKPDSQEICFIGDGEGAPRHASLLARRAPEALRAGDIVDSAGRVLGRHEGFARFTIGQRRGLGVAAGVPMYVTRIDPASATVTIGPQEEVMGSSLSASAANWHADVKGEFDATVQVRYNQGSPPRGIAAGCPRGGALGRVRITGADTFEVRFAQPVAAITPGQAAVVYDGQILLGGGWIG
jgi:tRNA-specific 2-thiouridylase